MTLLESVLYLTTLKPRDMVLALRHLQSQISAYMGQTAAVAGLLDVDLRNPGLTERRLFVLLAMAGAALGLFGFLRLVALLTGPEL